MDVKRFVERFVIAQTNRYTAAARKLLSIKGEEYGVSFGVHLEDERPEHSFLKGETPWAQFNQATSAAGTLAIIGVVNPAASGVLGVVNAVYAYAAAAGVVLNLQNGGGAPFTASSGAMFSRDLRARGGVAQAATTLKFDAGVGAAAPAGHIYAQHVTLAANDITDFITGNAQARVGPFILPPGSSLYVCAAAVGVNTVSAIFSGYERALESGELI